MQKGKDKRAIKLHQLWLCFLLSVLSTSAYANNLQVSNITLTGQNSTDDYYLVQFDLSWDNSWRGIAPANNWDAAWVFVKYRVGSDPWKHATLNETGHTAPTGSTIDTPADGKGVFIYRDAMGFGPNNWAGVQLRWNYGADGVGDSDAVEICVTGIEMVYVSGGRLCGGKWGFRD